MTPPPPEFWRALAIQLGLAFGMLTLLSFGWVIYLRSTIGNKVGCFFQEATGNLSFELIKYRRSPRDAEPVLVSKDKLEYKLEPQIQRRLMYPGGLPRFMQESVPFQCFIRGHWQPVDWYKQVDVKNPSELSTMMKNAKNTAVATDVMQSIVDKLGGNRMAKLQTVLMVGLFIIGAGLVAVGYLSYMNYDAMKDFKPAVERINTALGK